MVTDDVGVRNAEEFLLKPSLETFNIIPKSQRIHFVKQALKLHIADINFLCKSFVEVSAVLKDNQENLVPYTDAILHEAFEIPEEPETVVNGLLVHMGLLKSEHKIKPKNNDIKGSLLALEYAVKQEYFPKKLALYFIAFLSKPNTLLDGLSAVKNNLIQKLELL